MTDIVQFLLLFISGYLLGSIPFGYLIGKLNHIDIRQYGSGNIGATNASRKLGFIKGFLPVGILDFLKSYLFVIFIFSLPIFSPTEKLIISLAPTLGHIFSVFLKFKGGKGVSCTFGLLAAIFGWKFALIWFIIWLSLLAITRYMSLTNIIMLLSTPFFFWQHFQTPFSVMFAIFLILLISFTHLKNIKKLLKGEENKL